MSSLQGKLSALVLCATALVFCNPARADLVTNGGFETGSFSGWTLTGDSSFNGVQCPGPGASVHGGNCSAFFGPVGTTGGISQNLATTPGTEYRVDLFLKPDGGTPSAFSVTFGATTLTSLTNLAASSTFIEFTFFATATAANTVLGLNFRDDPGFILLDDVSVNAVPLPAALPLFATGLGALGLLSWRRKQKSALAA
jgi:hypothetical protein